MSIQVKNGLCDFSSPSESGILAGHIKSLNYLEFPMKLGYWAALVLVSSVVLQGCAAVPVEDASATTTGTSPATNTTESTASTTTKTETNSTAPSASVPKSPATTLVAASIMEKNKQDALALLDEAKKQNRKLTPDELEAVIRKLSVCSPS